MGLIRQVYTGISIAGSDFPVLKWRTTLANQGSMGTVHAEGALSDLLDAGLDIVELGQSVTGAQIEAYGGYDDSPLLFGGVVDSFHLDIDNNSFEVKGRDWSAYLADGRQTMAGMNYRNQTVAQIVKQIADQFEMGTDITDPGIKAGPLMNNENSFNPHPQSYWTLLQNLAEQVGFECYSTPDQVLYFGPEKDQSSITVNYGAKPGASVENPGWGLVIDYDPRNNSNIVVKALSMNPQTTKKVSASAQAKPVKLKKWQKTQSSQTGGNSKQKYPGFGKSGNSSPSKSIYYIRCPGMSADQAQARCQAMADNLAKHQIVCGLSIEGNDEVVVHSQVTLVEAGDISCCGFDGIAFNAAEVTHCFDMPQGTSSTGGFVTEMRLIAQVSD
jgi:phage protein D